jgi:hypothetical protein
MEMTKETLKMIEQIVTDYGKIIERTSWMVYGVPESILPYSKEMIKSAIINWLKIEKDESAKKNLRFGYSHLATFIPDYEANISVRAVIAIESRDPFHPNFDCIRESVNIQNIITDEMAKLMDEINSI